MPGKRRPSLRSHEAELAKPATTKDVAVTNGTSPKSDTTDEAAPDSFITPSASLSYWSSTSPTVSGMLGGYPQVSRVDIAGSRTFLSKLRRLSSPNSALPSPPARLRLAADCGAGIGRITTNFLVTVAEHVDVIEPVQKFTDQLRSEHPKLFSGDDPMVQHIFNTPLEDFTPPTGRLYDVIWNQWCLGHLTDTALTSYLTRLKLHLAAGGYIVIKENLSTHPFGEDVYDDEDSSVTRSNEKFERIFEEAGLTVRRSEVQGGGFGRGLGLMPVRMWGLQPREGLGRGGEEG